MNSGPPIIQYWHEEKTPAYLDPVFAECKRFNPDSEHLIFNQATAEELIAEHFGEREVAAFRACAVPSMQSDYFRYAAVLALGGIYLDVDFCCTAPFLGLTQEAEGQLFKRPIGMMVNGFFAFRHPGHPFLRLLLDVVTANIESRKVQSIVGVTGPTVLSALLMMFQLGSIEAFLEVSKNGGRQWQPQLMSEVVGDYRTISEAFRGVQINSIARFAEFLSNRDIAHVPYKQHRDPRLVHWSKWEKSIYR